MATIAAMRLNDLLLAELARRRAVSPRYSLRAFARALAMDHSALSRLLRRPAGAAPRSIHRIGRRLGWSPAQIDALCLAEHQPLIAAAVRRPDFRPSSRWLAAVTGLPVDAVNLTLQTLISSGRLRLMARDRWQLQDDSPTSP